MAEATFDPYKHLDLVLNPDGSLSRNSTAFPDIPPTPVPNPDRPTPVLSKDITFDHSNQTWFRIYLPADIVNRRKLPVIFYFHGGGFILCSAATSIFHFFCSDLAASLPAVVISVNYRLAPEHRLPAAYHDAVDAVRWVATNSRHVDWMGAHADLSSCFLMGTSAGGNIAYHAGVRLAASTRDLGPLRIRGLVLHQPFLGGVERAASELARVDDLMLRPGVGDMMWGLALPVGSGRDHVYCDIKVGEGAELAGEVKRVGWKVLVTVFEGDPLFDHVVEAVEFLREKGVAVAVRVSEGGFHAADIFDPSLVKPLYSVLQAFLV